MPHHPMGQGFGPVIRRAATSYDVANPTIKLMYYVYFLKLKNNDIYKGSASDLKIRIKEHEAGKVESTRNYRPVKLIGYEAYLLKSDAQRRERFLKTTEGMRLLRRQYRDIIKGK